MGTPSGYDDHLSAAALPRAPEIVVSRRSNAAHVAASRARVGVLAKADEGVDGVLEEAERVMRGVCQGLSRLLASMPTTIARPNDVERALKVDNPLASRVWRIASSEKPLSAVELLPTVNQLRAVVKAAERAGAKGAACERAAAAVEALGEYIETHAGDMGQFEALVARSGAGEGGGNAASDSLKLKHRRAAFKTNSQVWELQAKSFAACAIFHEADRGPASEDVAFFKGYAKLQVLQPNHRLELKTYAHLQNLPAAGLQVDPAQVGILLPALIEQHVEGPRPELVSKRVDNRLDTYMRFPSLGKSNASTFYVGQLGRNSDSLADVRPFWSTRTMIKVPCELLQLELWVPAGWSDPGSVFAEAFGCSSAPEQALESRDADRIDMYPQVQVFEGVVAREPPAAPEVEKWSEVVESIVEKHGLSDRRFDVYRCRVKYPILHTVVRLRVEAARGVGEKALG